MKGMSQMKKEMMNEKRQPEKRYMPEEKEIFKMMNEGGPVVSGDQFAHLEDVNDEGHKKENHPYHSDNS